VDEINLETGRTESETCEYWFGKNVGRSVHSLTRDPHPTRVVPRVIQRTQLAFGPGYKPRPFRMRKKNATFSTGMFYLDTCWHLRETEAFPGFR